MITDMVISDEELRKLHKAQLYIAEEIKRICDKKGIPFFLDCGSLLGAVRHKGFIPWDDDMDMGMLKEHYDRFVHIAPGELKDDFFLDDYSTNSNYPSVFSKVRLKGTTYLEAKGNPKAEHKEIFVDIAPYITVDDDIRRWYKDAYKLAFFGWALSAKAGYKIWKGDGIKKQILFMPSALLGKIAPCEYLRRKVNAIIDEKREGKNVCMIDGMLRSYKEWIVPKDLVREFTDVEFEGKMFPAPKEYDRFLTMVFGDYMTIPPEEKRVTHMVQELDFGGYVF